MHFTINQITIFQIQFLYLYNSLNETLVNLNEVVNIQTNVSLVKEKVNLKLYVENTLNILADQIKQKAISVNVLVNKGGQT